MSAIIHKKHFNIIINTDAYIYLLGFFDPSQLASLRLVSKTFTCLVEEMRRRCIRDLRSLWRLDPFIVESKDQIAETRELNNLVYRKVYYYNTYGKEPRINAIRETLNEKMIMEARLHNYTIVTMFRKGKKYQTLTFAQRPNDSDQIIEKVFYDREKTSFKWEYQGDLMTKMTKETEYTQDEIWFYPSGRIREELIQRIRFYQQTHYDDNDEGSSSYPRGSILCRREGSVRIRDGICWSRYVGYGVEESSDERLCILCRIQGVDPTDLSREEMKDQLCYDRSVKDE